MAATATILKLVSVDYLTNVGLTGQFFSGFDWRKVPFDDLRCRSFKMAVRQPSWIWFPSII
jgi:hypothetical protein